MHSIHFLYNFEFADLADEIRNDLNVLQFSVGMKYRFEINIFLGDIFKLSAPNSSLAHCISSDFEMSQGIAEIFCLKFDIKNGLRGIKAQIGDIAVIQEGSRYIYNLITKRKYSGKPTYQNLLNALMQMKIHALQNDVQEISMPKLACGRDNLNWIIVESMIKNEFSDTNITINVYHLGKEFSADIKIKL